MVLTKVNIGGTLNNKILVLLVIGRHVQRRPPEALVRNGVLERVDNVKRGRGRPKLTWDESVKRDLKDWNISKEIALDRSAWRLSMCLNLELISFGFHL